MADDKNKPLNIFVFFLCISTVRSQGTTPTQIVTTQGTTGTTPTINTTAGTTAPATTVAVTTPSPTQPPSSSTLPPNTDLGPCTCDLKVGACDVNCCCDEDCSADDRNAFSECLDTKFLVDEKVCLQSNQLILANTPYTVNTSVSGLFCIEFDNYADRNYYLIPDSVNTVERFDELVDEYGDYSYQVPSSEPVIYGEFYKSGDPIYTVYESLAMGVLGLANRLTSSLCDDNNPAAYLFDQSYRCTRALSDLESQCESMPALTAQTYYQGFKVASTPYLFQVIEPTPITVNITTAAPIPTTAALNATNATAAPTEAPFQNDTLYYHPWLLEVEVALPLLCIDMFGVKRECNFTTDEIPKPSYDAGSLICQDAIHEVTYMFTTNGTFGINSVQVQLVFGNITSNALPLAQTFASSFTDMDVTDVFKKSGNPGYVVAEPLLAGNEQTIIDDQGEERYSINLGSDRDNWLTVVSPTVNGDCVSDADSRASVTYGLSMRTGCMLEVYFMNMSDICESIQATINNTLFGDFPPTHVAMFGNSNPETFGDWVPILYSNIPSSAPTPSTGQAGVCRNMVLGVHLEILYADTGSLANPQPKIIGVTYRYADAVDLNYQCIGAYCRPESQNVTQAFEVISSVGFVDASSYPQGVLAEPPTFQAKLPYDFFYPFGMSAASHPSSLVALYVLCVALTALVPL